MAALRPFKRGIPLSLVIVRYFAYVIAALIAVWAASFIAISIAINMGAVYAASYGAGHIEETVEALRSAEVFDADEVPTAYRYLLVDDTGAVLAGDIPDEEREAALDVVRERLGSEDGEPGKEPAAVTGRNGATYTVFRLPDNTMCLLVSEFMPQFTSRALRDALPNPQDLMLIAACAGSVAAILLISHRASRVIARTMAPLTDAADRIANEDLEFQVGSSNVRQVNEVLEAMERMRFSLKESLEAHWRAEQAQRNQVAALAHDLKTPLTVVRANADYVAEEAGDMAKTAGLAHGVDAHGVPAATKLADALETAGLSGTADTQGSLAPEGLAHGVDLCGAVDAPCMSSSDGLADIAAAARDAAAAAERLDDYVRLLIEVSHGEAAVGAKEPVSLDAFAAELGSEAGALARTANVALEATYDPALADACIEADREALGRAVLNVVANALDYAHDQIDLGFGFEDGRTVFAIEVEDDGPGFSPEALEHGCERFFCGDASRTGAVSGGHYGIGLSTASEAARSCGGTVELSNRIGRAGGVLGARVVIRIPVTGDSASSRR
ncbi:sensor histidine kinase [Raoultibacter phocaeensis]|uniref:sensor histidine kinase n=1 Tax=Raoultibacter phocaeensis TaxID=2479841 RepID=UPI0011197247|nr:HAMP domain-containing sensor histidine kinase [Raoultibacter phocaeensis]